MAMVPKAKAKVPLVVAMVLAMATPMAMATAMAAMAMDSTATTMGTAAPMATLATMATVAIVAHLLLVGEADLETLALHACTVEPMITSAGIVLSGSNSPVSQLQLLVPLVLCHKSDFAMVVAAQITSSRIVPTDSLLPLAHLELKAMLLHLLSPTSLLHQLPLPKFQRLEM